MIYKKLVFVECLESSHVRCFNVLGLLNILIWLFKDWHLYVGSAVGLLSLRFPLLRAAVSKECSKDQIGAVFAGCFNYFNTLHVCAIALSLFQYS